MPVHLLHLHFIILGRIEETTLINSKIIVTYKICIHIFLQECLQKLNPNVYCWLHTLLYSYINIVVAQY
jgi:hypothetical protein